MVKMEKDMQRKGAIEIFANASGAEIEVKLDADTVWLSQSQLSELLDTSTDNVSLHLKNIYAEEELDEVSTIEDSSVVRQEGNRQVKRKIKNYNLDAIISVAYRVNSSKGTQFRIWATQRLKDYLVDGYAINEKRLAQKQQEVQHLKTGIRILSRAIEEKVDEADSSVNPMLETFAKGLALLDDYDHEALDSKGHTDCEANYPDVDDYLSLIVDMKSDYESDVFAKPKDESFESSVNQIRQYFDDKDLYPSLEEKAANLLYMVVKNHSFVDGNKRIAAACFLYFLDQNHLLFNDRQVAIISNEALASLTLFIASSKSDESDTVKKLIVSILNRSESL
jgi:prophage maintenance system killer protein